MSGRWDELKAAADAACMSEDGWVFQLTDAPAQVLALVAELVSVRDEREQAAEAYEGRLANALAVARQLRDALERARADLREIVYLQDGEPGERVVLTGRGVTTIAREGIRAAAAVSEETP